MKWIFLILLFALKTDNKSFEVSYQIDAASRLYLNGKTNISNYECYCKDEFKPTVLKGTKVVENGNTEFHNATLQIQTSLLSCKNRLMNRDMHKALKADQYPYITIQLHDAIPSDKFSELRMNTWHFYTANVSLTIAGITKKTQLHIKVNKQESNKYRLVSEKELLMSDFKVKPRTPFNMIRIEDKVNINFDMTIHVNEAN
ncbi:MAG: YceI family protein [Chitinophagaceae bacterium]|nr:YceI family protein [Chitinophagaceae bacterium]